MYRNISSLLFCIIFILLVNTNTVCAQLADKDMIAFTPAATQQVGLYWKDDVGKILGSLARLKQYTATKKRRLIFAMNAGMYMEDRSPLGLFIQNGKTIKQLNTRSGYGNFYMKPNGVFYITSDRKGHIITTGKFKPGSNITYATQSGPMLLVNGTIHPDFKQGSANLNVRNGVGVLPDGRMLFAMSKNEVNLYDFAAYFKSKGCKEALFLDGFISRTYYPAVKWAQTDGFFGVMIGITE